MLLPVFYQLLCGGAPELCVNAMYLRNKGWVEWPLQMQMSGIFKALGFKDHKAGLRLLLCFPSLSIFFLLQERGWHNWESAQWDSQGKIQFYVEITILEIPNGTLWNFLFKTGCSFLHTLHQRPLFPKFGVLQGSISLTGQLGGRNTLLWKRERNLGAGKGYRNQHVTEKIEKSAHWINDIEIIAILFRTSYFGSDTAKV